MDVELNYGRGTVRVTLAPDLDVTVVRKPAMPVLEDAEGAVGAALRAPVSARPLSDEALGKSSACILVCDITRPVPNRLLLRPLIQGLLEAGLDRGRITVMVATGLHRPNVGAELEELVGDRWVLDTVRVVNHDARDDAAHADLGTTPHGTRVRLDRRFVEADLKIVTGLVEPHFMAGYSGGRKVIAPGVAHRETITAFHASRFMADPRAENCVLEGNPLHREQLAIVAMLGRVLAVNVVIDERRRLSFVNYGEVVESHAEAVRFAERYTRVEIPRRFGTVLTSAAGYPLDKTYYQTVKGMVTARGILAPGGDLIVASECSEGMGSREYVEAQKRLLALGVDGFAAEIAPKEHADIDAWQTEMQLKPMRIGTVHLYAPRLAPEARALTGVDVVSSIEDTVARSVRRTGDRHVAVIPEGPYVVPVYVPPQRPGSSPPRG